MSSSSQHMQSLGPNHQIEPFRMESFDNPESGSQADTNNGGFELYGNLECETNMSFDYLVSSDAKCAEEIVAQSKDIVSSARKKADEIERDAYEKGFAQGQKDGYELGGKKLDKVLASIEDILKELAEYKARFVKENETEILALVRRIAECVVKGTVRVDNDVVQRNILEAFTLVSDPTEVTLRVSEEDLEHVKELRPGFFEQIEGLNGLTMEADPTVVRGGCILEAKSGNVDGRLETQLETIVSAMEHVDGPAGSDEEGVRS